MINYYDGKLVDILPSNLKKEPEIKALSAALQVGTRLLYKYTQRAYIFYHLDSLPDKILDLLAIELRAQYYDQNLSSEIKRKLIKTSLSWYMHSGTVSVVNEAIMKLFGDGQVEEWYEYGGDVHCFKISSTNFDLVNVNYDEMLETISKIKRVSAVFDGVKLYAANAQKLYFGTATSILEKVAIKADEIKPVDYYADSDENMLTDENGEILVKEYPD